MSNSFSISRIVTAVALAGSFAACEDVPTPSRRPSPTVVVEPSKPAELPPPPPVAVKPTEPEGKVEPKPEVVTVDNDDDGPRPAGALAGARKMLAAGDTAGALKLSKVAIGRSPQRSGAWNTLGRVQLQMGKRKDAISSFGKAVELNPRNSYAQNNLGLALIYDKRYDEAVEALEQAVELEPVEDYMWNNLGMAYEQLDRLGEARDAYAKAVEMDNDRARESLARLEGVKSVIRTAKVDTEPKDGKEMQVPSSRQ